MADMTISVLIEKLAEVRDRYGDVAVVMSSDEEGNSFESFCGDISEGYFWESGYSEPEFHTPGYFGDHPEGLQEWEEWIADPDVVKAICLWP